MRIAWFRPEPPASAHSVDDTASLLAELGSRHTVEVYGERRAHDFVWHHARQPFDICVYELADTPSAGFVWPYLLHFPGLVRVRSGRLLRSRADVLQHQGRAADYAAELTFGGAPGLRIALLASRLVVVADSAHATALQQTYPDAHLRHAPIGVAAPPDVSPRAGGAPVFTVTESSRVESVARAAARAHDAGCRFELRVETDPLRAVRESDGLIALEWPPASEPPLAALLGMAAARAAVVYETAVTAAWPALDPQTWQPRGYGGSSTPAVISIDPMDDEHSLMLALRRLASDAGFRAGLGSSAQAWWRANATPAHAAAAWERLLEEGRSLDPPPHPPDWPRHLTTDGTEHTRALLSEFGASVDFLE